MVVMSLPLELKIGQMIVAGFPGTALSGSSFESLARSRKIGNAILFARNIGTPEELFELTRSIKALMLRETGFPPLIAIDQEGGMVTRIRSGATFFPGAMACSAAGSLGDAGRMALAMGRELRALGVNFNLAPVADVNLNPANPVIGVRSFGEDPGRVSLFASAYARGFRRAGILCAAKHFPGHGDTDVDSHLGLPTVPHGLDRLRGVELVPFKRLISEGIPAIMTAHILFPALEPGGLPATLSSAVLTGLLRRELGFKGLIVTDCLEMGAIAGGFPEAAVLAVEAGADLLFVSHTPEAQERAAVSIAEAVRAGRISESRIDESVSRILSVKKSLPPQAGSFADASRLVGSRSHQRLAEGVSLKSVTMIRNDGFFPFVGSVPLLLDDLPRAATGAEDVAGGPTLAAALREAGIAVDSVPLPEDPGERDIERIAGLAMGRNLIAATRDAGMHAGRRACVEAAAAAARRAGLVAMRSPYDAAVFDRIPSAVCAYEYTPVSVKSVAAFITGKTKAKGKCPVTLSLAVKSNL